MPTALLLAVTVATASPAEGLSPAPPRNAVVVDPLAPALALVLRALELPALDLNLRGHRILSDSVGITAELDYTSLAGAYTVRTWHTGGRVGARLALRGRGLSDWTVTPFVLGGVTGVTVDGYGGLARYGVLGSGVEAGRTWVWGPVALDLGVGLYTAMNLGYQVLAPAAEGTEVGPGPFLRPLVDLGIGHAW